MEYKSSTVWFGRHSSIRARKKKPLETGGRYVVYTVRIPSYIGHESSTTLRFQYTWESTISPTWVVRIPSYWPIEIAMAPRQKNRTKIPLLRCAQRLENSNASPGPLGACYSTCPSSLRHIIARALRSSRHFDPMNK